MAAQQQTQSSHYINIMQLVGQLETNTEEYCQSIELLAIPQEEKEKMKAFCAFQKDQLELLGQRLDEFEDTHQILRKENLIDAMTGFYAKKHLLPIIEEQIAKNNRRGKIASPDCIVVIDLNNMKKLNALFGHFGADDILIEIATIAKSFLRPGDRPIRVGGDEAVFLISSASAQTVAKMIVRRMANYLRTDPIQAIPARDRKKQNPKKVNVCVPFCLGAANLPKDMPKDSKKIREIIALTLREADELEGAAKKFSKKNRGIETTAAYHDENGEIVIKTEAEITAEI